MKIEPLYFEDCPNWVFALGELKDVLRGKGMADEVSVIQVTSNEEAERLRFPGSPTIRIDWRDLNPDFSAFDFSLSCRVYAVDGMPQGMPPKEWIAAAIEAALG